MVPATLILTLSEGTKSPKSELLNRWQNNVEKPPTFSLLPFDLAAARFRILLPSASGGEPKVRIAGPGAKAVCWQTKGKDPLCRDRRRGRKTDAADRAWRGGATGGNYFIRSIARARLMAVLKRRW